MILAMSHTRTHVNVTFANPYLACDQCGQRVAQWHDPVKCGCGDSGWQNKPCGHQAGATSVCPSWGPVDGCTCVEHLGRRDHGEPPAPTGFDDPLEGRNR